VKAEICENRRQVPHLRLESITGAENPYSLMVPRCHERCHGVGDQVPASGGHSKDAHQLHQRDPG
jgi:hypothetical protein